MTAGTRGWAKDTEGELIGGALEVSPTGRLLVGMQNYDWGESRITHHVHESGYDGGPYRQIAIHVACGWIVVLDLPDHPPIIGLGEFVGTARRDAKRAAAAQGIEIKGLAGAARGLKHDRLISHRRTLEVLSRRLGPAVPPDVIEAVLEEV